MNGHRAGHRARRGAGWRCCRAIEETLRSGPIRSEIAAHSLRGRTLLRHGDTVAAQDQARQARHAVRIAVRIAVWIFVPWAERLPEPTAVRVSEAPSVGSGGGGGILHSDTLKYKETAFPAWHALR
jgi:hypothetical protein